MPFKRFEEDIHAIFEDRLTTLKRQISYKMVDGDQ